MKKKNKNKLNEILIPSSAVNGPQGDIFCVVCFKNPVAPLWDNRE